MHKRLYVHADNLHIAGRVYKRGDIGYFEESATTDALVNAGALSQVPHRPKVDKHALIVDNGESISASSEDKSNGNKRKSKSRGVRSSSETIPEGLPGAEPSD